MVGRKQFNGVAIAVIAASIGFAAPACAQQVAGQDATGDAIQTFAPDTNTIDSNTYDRGRNVSVLERPRPEYQAQGVQVGGFTVYPKLTASGAYDDNVFADPSGGPQGGDFVFRVAPEVDFQSNWSRDSLSGYVRASQDEYAKFSTEDATQYGAGVAGKLQFGNSDLTGGVDYGHFVLPRSVSNNFGPSVHPLDYDYTAVSGQLATEFTRVRLSVRVDDETYWYHNGTTTLGAVVDDQDQNVNELYVTGKAEFAINADTAAYVLAKGNQQAYQLNPPTVPLTKNSSGYEVDLGANLDLTHLLRGEVQVGYLQQDYVSPQFKTLDGLSGRLELLWFPTQLTTVTAVASRSVGDALVVGASGFITSDASLRVDHELLRNLILSADGWYGFDQYNGLPRSDARTGLDLQAEWLLNRHVGVSFAYDFSDQRSTGSAAGQSFDDNRGIISFVFQL
jgi:hypothetical protein